MIESIEAIFKTFGFFGIFVAGMVYVIITLYRRDEQNRLDAQKEHEANLDRIKQLEDKLLNQLQVEREQLIAVINENTKAMKRISFYIKRFKKDDNNNK